MKQFDKNEHTGVIKDCEGGIFDFTSIENSIIMIILYSWYLGGENIHISITKKSN